MNLDEFAAYGYLAFIIFLVVTSYSYIYHLYTKKKDVTGVDYENYSNMALKDNIGDAPVKPILDDKNEK